MLLHVLIADADTLVQEGLDATFACQADMRVVGYACSGRQALELYSRLRPDVLVMEARLPDMSGLQVIATLCKKRPESSILVLSRQAGDEAVYWALQAGARGYLLKEATSQAIVTAVRRVAAGKQR